jgi:dolichol-phosphate mannosyltransferase
MIQPAQRGLEACVVIPTYNERENLPQLIDALEKVASDREIRLHVLVVDDRSPDGTGELAEDLAKKYRIIRVLHRSEKKGLGSAYKDGFKTALDDLGAGIVFEMDADLSHDPAFLPAFLEKLHEGFDVVVGARYIPEGKIVGWNLRRKLTSWGGNFLTRTMLGLKAHDATSGYRAYTSAALRGIDLDGVRSEGYAFQVEMLFRCARRGFKIGEVPITFVDRVRGESKLSGREILRFAGRVFRLSLARLS